MIHRSNNSDSAKSLIPAARIEKSILLIRGQKVMLDSDLAQLYGVSTGRLNEQVHRNRDRFPSDFMFQMNRREYDRLISHFAISKSGRGGRRKLPLVFTEQGVAMLSSVLHSDRAVEVNIAIMRTFVRLREILSSHKELAQKLNDLEAKYDEQFSVVFEAIRQLMEPPVPKKHKRRIGFRLSEE